ncbi:hypothetical protein BaRGS_00009482 [Batillaria attramentaria]|uniref:Uncharacterized protein n=1 Tax=Batillaria attramentaria TaxID=370345 RepID=A0ABD0LIS1_9CAEN
MMAREGGRGGVNIKLGEQLRTVLFSPYHVYALSSTLEFCGCKTRWNSLVSQSNHDHDDGSGDERHCYERCGGGGGGGWTEVGGAAGCR